MRLWSLLLPSPHEFLHTYLPAVLSLLFLVAHRDADNATAVTAPSDFSNDEISNVCIAVKMYIRR